ncbi:DedA family protein [Thiorhodovibrio winogradskyi]|nr:DedA family protein [Thiorhodovibrio winogradskyi]
MSYSPAARRWPQAAAPRLGRPAWVSAILLLLVLSLVTPLAWAAGASAENSAESSADSSTGSASGPGPHPSLMQDVGTGVVHELKAAVHHVRPLVDRYGYAAAFAAMLVEGFGVPAPGQTLMMASALEAAEGRLSIYLVLGLAFLAAVLGNTLGYMIGRYGGTALLRRLHVNEKHEARIARLFERFGGSLILFARFFDGLRQLNGIVAGVLNMRLSVFMVFNVLGAVLYVTVWGLGTFYLREHLPRIYDWSQRINPWIAALAVLGVLLLLIYLLRGRNRAGVKKPSA